MIRKMAILVGAFIVLTLASCSFLNDSSLVGKWDWKVYGTTISTYEFTADGKFINTASSVSVTYGYSASAGKGKYWFESSPASTVDFSYVITNNTMDLTIAGVELTGLVKR